MDNQKIVTLAAQINGHQNCIAIVWGTKGTLRTLLKKKHTDSTHNCYPDLLFVFLISIITIALNPPLAPPDRGNR